MRSSMVRFVFLAALAAMPLVLTTEAGATERLVAVGDIHGEYDGFVSILQKAGLVDQKLQWTGGKTTLVQTGDFVDRGADVRKVLDLLMKLESAARRRRGRVVVLLGNHELMNLTSVLRDANPAAYAAFADRRSERRRQAAYRQYVSLHERLAKRYSGADLEVKSESEWMDEHPPGFIEYQAAFSRTGKYGRWLRNKPGIAKVGDAVFLHGGISPDYPEQSLDKMNEQARREVEAFDRIRDYLVSQQLILPFFTFPEISDVIEREAEKIGDGGPEPMRLVIAAFRSLHNWSIHNPEGPFWFRGFADWSDEEGEREIDALLSRFDARRFVVGHTIPRQGNQVLPRFGGKVFLIDTGMLRGYENGRASALEINGQSFSAIYESGRVNLNLSSASPQVHYPYPAPLSAAVVLIGNDRQEKDLSRSEPALAQPRRQQEGFSSVTSGRVEWKGPGGDVLPFRSNAEILDFLRSARVIKVERKKLSGVTRPLKMLVGNGRVRAHAVFRYQHREEENARWETGQYTEFLRDTYKSEIAAYELSLLLGLDTVPPTVPWTMKRRPGSLQIFIEGARPGWHPLENTKPADPELWEKHRETMRVFDALIHNVDRHEGNMLVDPAGRVWWIDHSRAFGRERDLNEPELVQRCDRRLWEALKKIDPTAISQRMAPFMSGREIEALLDRRERLIALIERRISEHGEAAVLYSTDPAREPGGAATTSPADDQIIMLQAAR